MSDDPFELIIVGRDAVTGEPIFAKRRKVPPLAVEGGVHADGSQIKASPFGHGRSDRRHGPARRNAHHRDGRARRQPTPPPQGSRRWLGNDAPAAAQREGT
jgi:hypothetical protein